VPGGVVVVHCNAMAGGGHQARATTAAIVTKAISPFPAATAGGRRRSSPPAIHRPRACEGNMAGLKRAFQGEVCV
jgi:hypothetical protein